MTNPVPEDVRAEFEEMAKEEFIRRNPLAKVRMTDAKADSSVWLNRIKDFQDGVAYGLELNQRSPASNEGAVPVYTVPIEVEGHDVLYRLQDHPEPRSDCGVLYTTPPSPPSSRELLEVAEHFEALIQDRDNPYDNALHYCANYLRALIPQEEEGKV
jgi:hypothetical protein